MRTCDLFLSLFILLLARLDADAFQLNDVGIKFDGRYKTAQQDTFSKTSERSSKFRNYDDIDMRRRSPTQLCRGSSPLTTTRLQLATLPPPSALSTITKFLQSFPYLAAFLICGTKASLADVIAQKKFDPRPDVASEDFLSSDRELESNVLLVSSDSGTGTVAIETRKEVASPFAVEDDRKDNKVKTNKWRTFAFLLYGGFYQGCIYEYVFNHFYPVVFGTSTDTVTVMKKVMFDLAFFAPLISLPVAYFAKAAIFQYGIREALSRYWHDVTQNGLLKKYWLLWGPVNSISFKFVPVHFRISFMAAISFFWMIALSYISAKGDAAAEDSELCRLSDGYTCE